MNSRQEMEELLKVESLIHQATRLSDHLDRRIMLKVDEKSYLLLHDYSYIDGHGGSNRLDYAKKACKEKIVDALIALKWELCRIIHDDLDCYLEYVAAPPDINNEAPLCECGEPTCMGQCGQNPE